LLEEALLVVLIADDQVVAEEEAALVEHSREGGSSAAMHAKDENGLLPCRGRRVGLHSCHAGGCRSAFMQWRRGYSTTDPGA
jgi:hypothetical protein